MDLICRALNKFKGLLNTREFELIQASRPPDLMKLNGFEFIGSNSDQLFSGR